MALGFKIEQFPVARAARFVAMVAVAVAAGHLVQTLSARKPAVATAEAVIKPTHIVQLSAGAAEDVALPPLMMAEPHRLAVEAPSTLAKPACPTDLQLMVQPSALLGLALAAPCHAGQSVVLQQAGLKISARVGMNGRLDTVLPAWTETPVVAVMFEDGARLERAMRVPEAAAVRRIGVQWQGADAFALHAIAEGADFGQPGDVWNGNPGVPGPDGFLMVLGDASVRGAFLAEVYTYPAEPAARPEIVLEAAVMKETCGRTLAGEVVLNRSGRFEAVDLTLAMPDCSAVGDFLVLRNLASDLKIAAN